MTRTAEEKNGQALRKLWKDRRYTLHFTAESTTRELNRALNSMRNFFIACPSRDRHDDPDDYSDNDPDDYGAEDPARYRGL